MQDSKVLPDLRMFPVQLLVPHEDVDPRRTEKLSKRLLEEGMLKNPPMVATIPGSDRYIVLDGANRVMAFVLLKIPHIVAQLVNYSNQDVILDTWYHVVAGISEADFERGLTEMVGLELVDCSLDEARRAMAAGEALAYIVCEDGVRKALSPQGRHHRDLRLLNEIVSVYRGKADIFRASNDIWEIQKPYYPAIAALVIFPRLQPEDLLYAAQNNYKVPSGITRHVIPARALNINIPIGIMMMDWPLERKEQWLQEWLMDRMAANAIRYYAESTFSFNE
jgi:hypothetical protein